MDYKIKHNSNGIGYAVINGKKLFADDIYDLIDFISETTDNRQEMAEMYYVATILDNGKSQFFERTFMNFLSLLTKSKEWGDTLSKFMEIYDDKTIHCSSFKTYLMTDSTGLIKIGKSCNPLNRLKNHQTSNTTARLIAISNRDVESELHHKFSIYHHQGEWFALSKELVDHIIREYNFTRTSDEQP